MAEKNNARHGNVNHGSVPVNKQRLPARSGSGKEWGLLFFSVLGEHKLLSNISHCTHWISVVNAWPCTLLKTALSSCSIYVLMWLLRMWRTKMQLTVCIPQPCLHLGTLSQSMLSAASSLAMWLWCFCFELIDRKPHVWDPPLARLTTQTEANPSQTSTLSNLLLLYSYLITFYYIITVWMKYQQVMCVILMEIICTESIKFNVPCFKCLQKSCFRRYIWAVFISSMTWSWS